MKPRRLWFTHGTISLAQLCATVLFAVDCDPSRRARNPSPISVSRTARAAKIPRCSGSASIKAFIASTASTSRSFTCALDRSPRRRWFPVM